MTIDPSSPRARVGAAIRQLGHDVVGHHADDAVLDEIAQALSACSGRIVAGSPRSREKAEYHEHWDSDIADGDSVASFDDRPLSGVCSPWSVEPDVRRHGEGVIARVTFHAAHEGAPDRCHGGIVAALFDDMLGSVLSVIGEGAFTGELTVRYEAPVPLRRELVCICRIDGRDGRKLYFSGELTDDGQVLSRATSTFIVPRVSATQSTFDPA